MQSLGRNLLLGTLFGVVVYAALLFWGDVSGIGRSLAAFHWPAFAAALGLALANYLLRFAKWEIYRRQLALRIPVGENLLIFLAGFSMSVTPAKLGEVLKSFLMKERHGIPVATTAPMVLADRLTDLLALLLLVAWGTLALGLDPGLVLVGGACVVSALVVAVGVRPVGERLARILARMPLLRRRPAAIHELFRSAWVLCRAGNLLIPTALSVAAWFAECAAFLLVVGAFPGAGIDLGLAVFIYSAATVAGALAMVPGGVGIAEGGMTGMLVLLGAGIAADVASAATIVVRLATLWFAVVVGLAALGILRARSPRRAE